MEVAGLFFVLVVFWFLAAIRKARREAWKRAYEFDPAQAHGSARYANKDDLEKARLFKKGGIHIGFFEGRKLFVNSSSHLLLVLAAGVADRDSNYIDRPNGIRTSPSTARCP